MFTYDAPQELLTGRIILVTGAGDGIGKAAAHAYASHGATVILLGRTLEKLEQVYDELEAQGYPQPAIVPMNLETAAEHDYIELTNQLEETFGRLDGILHNAGVLGLRTSLESYDPIIWQQVMQVNLNAPFLLTQTLMPLLRRSDDASVIFTSSGVGRKGRAHWGAYAVSKFATEGMAQVMADELENISSVRVNCINPGATRTSMRAYAYPAEAPETNPTPKEIMPVYLYLMGSESKAVNGQSLDAQGDGSA
ncbi:YciK family oxidoreductase [Marinobacterium mangrovicola]|uniref:NAD(P)-dependent dehydrogenase (Short-subunit alcohol dehydrogenase family) n=1 Tax=Marinobacterium mangrovicola TaxID=1476959 RepID=A0A4R1G4Y7_9GAMM|nr:YciK family oxidoreductase [Marinobacterium mangrovicola]TCK03047.1 NAD(P)-dependent dehydrogenase (short-subunit alcohol dehydrogenase family) [Marinobacterium mangrovicola]